MTREDVTPRTRLHIIGDWTLGRTLGRGAYAHVRLATHSSGHQTACKILPALHRPRSRPISHDELMDAVEAYKEVVLLKALAGAGIKGIVGLEGVIQGGGWTYIFLTLHNASASHIKKRLKVSELIYFFRQLLRTVHALHVLSVSHEDIKRSNILFSKSGSPVLVDFGFSHFKSDGGKVKSAGGTLDYSSPEKVEDTIEDRKNRENRRDTRYDPQASDVWSLGILLLKLLKKPHPFMFGDKEEDSDRIRAQIIESKPRYLWTSEESRPGGFAELVMGMLDKNPVTRLKIPQIIQHPSLQFQHHTMSPWKFPTPHQPKKLSATVVADVAFLTYLNQDFPLCESYAKIKERILDPGTTWEKQWAGFLSKWKGSLELDARVTAGAVGRVSALKNEYLSTPTKTTGGPLKEIHLSPNISKKVERGVRPSGLPVRSRKPVIDSLVKRPTVMKPPKPGPYVGRKAAAHVKDTQVVINSPKRQIGCRPRQDFARSRKAMVRTSRAPTVGSPTLATLGSATRDRLPLYSTGGVVSTATSAAGSEDESSGDEKEFVFPFRRAARVIKPFPQRQGAGSSHEAEAGPSNTVEAGERVIRRSNRLVNKALR